MKIWPKWSHFLFVNESNITTTKQKGENMRLEWKIFSANNFRGQLSFSSSSSLPHKKWQIESKNPLCKHNFRLFVDQIYLLSLFGVIFLKVRLFAFLINYWLCLLSSRNVVFFLDSRDLREVHDLVSQIFRSFVVFLNEWRTPFWIWNSREGIEISAW